MSSRRRRAAMRPPPHARRRSPRARVLARLACDAVTVRMPPRVRSVRIVGHRLPSVEGETEGASETDRAVSRSRRTFGEAVQNVARALPIAANRLEFLDECLSRIARGWIAPPVLGGKSGAAERPPRGRRRWLLTAPILRPGAWESSRRFAVRVLSSARMVLRWRPAGGGSGQSLRVRRVAPTARGRPRPA